MENKQIKVKIIKQVPVIRTLNIVDLDTWNLNKNNFIIQCNSAKDMGGYIDSDYCSEEYGIEPCQDEEIDLRSRMGRCSSIVQRGWRNIGVIWNLV
jgi:hypothetical protein